MRSLHPAALHLDSRGVRWPFPAHAPNDLLGEENPDLLVVVELRMTLHLGDRVSPRFLIPSRIEVEPVAQPKLPISVRPKLGPGPRQGEVNIEDNGPQHNPK